MTFEDFERLLAEAGPAAAFDQLAAGFLATQQYPRLFEARVMKKRHELGLPLISSAGTAVPPEIQKAVDDAYLAAARETGGLFLAAGDIVSAWPYHRAIGETAPIAAAIDKFTPDPETPEVTDRVVEIAYHEGANPQKGFELLLASHGTCRAITMFNQYPQQKGREDCANLLVATLHAELVERLRSAIAEAEGAAPETHDVAALIEGRDWLFGEWGYYVDTSHLVSIVQLALELKDPVHMRKALALTDYGRRLNANFQFKGDPPFESVHADYGVYLWAMLGERVEEAIAYFHEKAVRFDPEDYGYTARDFFVTFLIRLGRFSEAIGAHKEFLTGANSTYINSPSVLDICQMAGDYVQMKELAAEKGDLLSYAAAAVSAGNGKK